MKDPIIIRNKDGSISIILEKEWLKENEVVFTSDIKYLDGIIKKEEEFDFGAWEQSAYHKHLWHSFIKLI